MITRRHGEHREKGAQGYEEVRDKKELSVPSVSLCGKI